MAKSPRRGGEMRVFYPVWQVTELAAGYRYTTRREGPRDRVPPQRWLQELCSPCYDEAEGTFEVFAEHLHNNHPHCEYTPVSHLALLFLTMPDCRPTSSFCNDRRPCTMSGATTSVAARGHALTLQAG